MSSKRKFNRKSKYTLSQKIISAVTAAGFIMQPVVGFAHNIVVSNGSGTKLDTNGNVTNIWAGQIVNNTAINKFDKFGLNASEIANMYFGTSKDNQGAANLVNFVNDRIDINGTVNAIQNNQIGGNLFFLSKEGMAVGKSGVINTGSLYVMTPALTDGDFNATYAGLEGIFNSGQEANVNTSLERMKALNIPLNASGTISVLGTINATGDVKMAAPKIAVGKNVSGTDLNDGENGAVGTKVNDVVKTASIKTGITDFSNFVNLTKKQQQEAGITSLTAEVSGNGDIVLAAKAEYGNSFDQNFSNIGAMVGVPTPTTADTIEATVENYGTITARGDAVLTAEVTNGNKDWAEEMLATNTPTGVNNPDYVPVPAADASNNIQTVASVNVHGDVTAGGDIELSASADNTYVDNGKGIIDSFKNSTLDLATPMGANVMILSNKAEVTVGQKADIKAEGVIDVYANAVLDGTAGEAVNGRKLISKVPAAIPSASVVYTHTENEASVTIEGNLTANGKNITVKDENGNDDKVIPAVNVSAYAEENLSSNAALNLKSGMFGAQSGLAAAVNISESKNNANVKIDGNITAEKGDAVVKANTFNLITTNASTNAPDDTVGATAVNVVTHSSEANITVNGDITAQNVTVDATNYMDENTIMANNALGMGKLQGQLMNAVDTQGIVNALKKNPLINKGDEGSADKPGIFKQLSEKLAVGAAVVVADENNTANVTFGKTADITATTGSIKADADVKIYDSHLYASGTANSYKNNDISGSTDTVTVGAGVVYAGMKNTASVVFADGDSADGEEAHASLNAGKDINITSGTVMEYHRPERIKREIDRSIENLMYAIEAIKNLPQYEQEQYKELITGLQNLKTNLEGYAKNYSDEFVGAVSNPDAITADGTMNQIFDAAAGAVAIYNDVLELQQNFNDMLDVTSPFSAVVSNALGVVTNAVAYVDPNNYANVAASASAKGGGEGTKLSVSGSVTVTDYNNISKVDVGRFTELNAQNDLNLKSANKVEDVNITGKTMFWKLNAEAKGGLGIGASVNYQNFDTDSSVVVDEGAELEAGDISLGSDSDIFHVGAMLAAGQSDGSALNGMVTITDSDSYNNVIVDSDAVLKAKKDTSSNNDGTIDIWANNNTSVNNAILSLSASGSNVGAGIGVAINNIDVQNTAQIADNDGTKGEEDELKGEVSASSLSVNAETTGLINTISIAGGMTSSGQDEDGGFFDKIKAPFNKIDDAKKNALDGISNISNKLQSVISTMDLNAAGGSAATGAEESGVPGFTFAGAGSVSLNMVGDTTKAVIDGANIKLDNDGTLQVGARDSAFTGAWSGGAALSFRKGSGQGGNTSVAVSGAVGVNDIDNEITALVKNSTVTGAKDVDVAAVSGGTTVAAGIGATLTEDAAQGKNYSGGASVSVNLIDKAVNSNMEGVTLIGDAANKANVDVAAYESDVQVTGGVNANIATGGGSLVGGGVTVANIKNNINAGITGGTYTNVNNVNVKGLLAVTQVTAAVSAGVAAGNGNAFSGAVVYNGLSNNINAGIDNGANISADGTVAVTAKDTESSSKEAEPYQALLGDYSNHNTFAADRGIDTTGSSYYTDLDTNGESVNYSDSEGSTIVGAAFVVAGGKDSAGGAAVNIADIDNDFKASIDNSTIKAGSVSTEADADTLLVGAAGGVAAGATSFGGMGSVSWQDIDNDLTSEITDSNIKTSNAAAKAVNKTQAVNVAGSVSVGKSAAVGATLAYNALDNTVGAYMRGNTISAWDGGNVYVIVNADNTGKVYGIGAGVSASTKVAINGSVSVNRGGSNTEAVIDKSDEKESSINNAGSVKVTADDETYRLAVVGQVSAAGKAAIGGGVAYNDIGGSSAGSGSSSQNTTAAIKNTDITMAANSEKTVAADGEKTVGVNVAANDSSELNTIAVGVAAAPTAGVQGSAATALINKNVSAEIENTNIDYDGDSKNANVTVDAQNDSSITTSADTASVAGQGAGVGAGVAVNRIIQQTNAAVKGGTMNVNNLTVNANGTPSIENIGIGIAVAGQGVSAAGSVSVNMIDNDVTAHIGDGANIVADDNVGVIATSDEQIANYSGMLSGAGQGAGVGISVSVNQINGNTSATVGDEDKETYVTALGKDADLITNTDIADSEINNALISSNTVNIDSKIDRTTEKRSGLVVDASSTRDMKSFLINVAGAGQGAGVAPTVNVNMINGATNAGITDTTVNNGSSNAGNVFVNAGDYTNMSGFVGSGGIAGMGAGVGLGSDTNTVSREVTAIVSGSDINAGEFEIDAESMQGVSSFVVGAAVGGIGAGVAGVVTVTELDNETKAALQNSKVEAGKVTVNANHKGIVNAGNVGIGGAGIGAGVGLSVGVLKDDSKTYAEVTSDSEDKNSITATGDVKIAATNTAVVKPSVSATGVAGVGAGVAGATSVNNLNSKVVTNISGVDITSGGSISGTADNTFNVDAYMGSQAGGVGGVGVGVTVNTIDSTVQTNVTDSTLDAAEDITLTAQETRTIKQTATNVAAGGVAVGANIAITNVGQAVENIVDENGETVSNAYDKITEANDVYKNKETGEDNSGDLLAGAEGALETAGIDSDKAIPHVGAGYGGENKESQITVNITNSNIEAANNVTAKATENDKINMTLGSGAAGAAAVNAGVGILNVHRNVGVNITGGSITAGNAVNVGTDINGEAKLNVYQGSGGVVAVNAAYAGVKTTGSSDIDLSDVTIAGKNISIAAQDNAKTDLQAVGVAAGVAALGALAAEAANDSDVSVNMTGTTVTANEDKDDDESGKVEITTNKANTVTAQAVNTAGGAIGGTGMGATVTDTGSSTIGLTGNTMQATKNIDVNAKTNSALQADIISAGAGWFASGAVSIAKVSAGTANDHLKTAVTIGGGNTFAAQNTNFAANSNISESMDMDALAISGYASIGGNSTTSDAYADATVTAEADNTYKGAADNAGNVSFNANNTVTQKADTSGISAAGLFATGTNIGTTTSDLKTAVTVKGSGEGSKVNNFNANASSYASVNNKVNGDGGAIADISPYAAKVDNNYTADTDVTIGGTWNTAGSFTAQAVNGMDIDLTSEAVRAAVIGGSGTWLDNTINNAANVTVNGATINSGGAQSYTAQNDIDYTGKIDGSGYGGINVNATDYSDDLDFTAGVDIKESTLHGTGDSGSITAFANTRGNITTKNSLKSAGVIPISLAFSDHAIDYRNSVDVESSELTTDKKDQNITLAATDDTDVKLETIADTQGGLAGAASAEASNKFNRSNKITVGSGSDLLSSNDANLYAGADLNGITSSLDLQVLADAYNKTALPVYTDPTVTNNMTQANQVVIESGANVDSVRHANLKAGKGTTTVTESAQEYNIYQGTGGSGTVTSTAFGEAIGGEVPDNYIQIDGNVNTGIHNSLNIDISGNIVMTEPVYNESETAVVEDGKVDYSGIKAVATETWFDDNTIKPSVATVENNLLTRYNEITDLLQQYQQGTTEYKSLKDEQTNLLNEMEDLGFATLINGKLVPVSEIEIPAIEIPDIVVSGGNINLETDTVKGGGKLDAQGAGNVSIKNSSDAYLIVNDITMKDAGGQIKLNGSELTAESAGNSLNMANVNSTAASSESPEITITGTTAGTSQGQPDIGIFGDITNTAGDVTIENKNHSITVLGNINARNINLIATHGDITQTSTEGLLNIGSDPVIKYQFSEDVAKKIQQYIYDQYAQNEGDYTIPEFKDYKEYTDWLKNKVGLSDTDLQVKEPKPGAGSIVAGGNVYISGLNVNIAGLVQSGYGDYSVTLDETAKNVISQIDKNWQNNGKKVLTDAEVMSNDAYCINDGGEYFVSNIVNGEEQGVFNYEVKVYYNPSTGQLLTDTVEVSGGKVYITGNISSTGGGRIMAMDGTADININTSAIDKDVVVNTITNNDINGLVSITDKQLGKVTEYMNGQTRTYNIGAIAGAWQDGNSNYSYNVKEGLQYQWIGGVSGEVIKKYQYTEDFLFWGLLDYGKTDEFVANLKAEGKDIIETPVSSNDKNDKGNGVVITTGGTGNDFSITGSYKPTNEETFSEVTPDMQYDGFWGKVFGYGETTYTWTGTKGTASSTTTSIAADKDISIGFIGNGNNQGNINVTTGKDMLIAGNISNAEVNGEGRGSVNLTSNSGSVSAVGNANINSDIVNIKAATGVNVNHSAIGNDADINIATNSGDIKLVSGKGDLNIVQAVTGGADPINAETGSVYLEAQGDILNAAATGNYAVKGQRIDLISHTGTIGTKDKALTVLGGSELYSSNTMASSVNAQAYGDIVLTQTSGNMRLGTINSEKGDAVLTVTSGSFVDAHPSENNDNSSAQDKIDRWTEAGLISDQDEADVSTISAEQAKKERMEALDNQANSLAYEAIYDDVIKPEVEKYQEAADAFAKDENIVAAKQKLQEALNEAGDNEEQIAAANAEYQQAVDDYFAGKDYNADEQQFIADNDTAAATKYVFDNSKGNTVQSYKDAAKKLAAAFANNADLQAAKDTYLNDYKAASAAHSKEIAAANGDEAKIKQINKDYQAKYDAITNDYLAEQAKVYGDGFSAEEQQLISSYAEVDVDESNYGWSKNQLLYAIQESVLTPGLGEVQTVETPNITANNITLKAASGGVGIDGEAEVIKYAELGEVESLKLLAQAKADDLTWDKYNQQVTIQQQQAITVNVKKQDGKVDVTGRDNVYLAGVDNTVLNIDGVTTEGDIRLQGDAGINVEGTLSGYDLTIAGGTGSIMGTGSDGDKYVDTAIRGTLDANAEGSIYISQNGDLKVLTVAAGEVADLKATNNILMSDVQGSMAQGHINAQTLNLTAGGNSGNSGNIGTNGTDVNAIRIADNGVVINAAANGDIILAGAQGKDSTGSIVLGDIKGANLDVTSISNINLGREDYAATEEDETVNSNINAGTVELTTSSGSITETEGSAVDAETVKATATQNVLLAGTGNAIDNFVVNGYSADNSLTGNVDLVSTANNENKVVNVEFGKGKAGLTVNNGYVNVSSLGDTSNLNISGGSVTTTGESAGDVTFTSEGSITADTTVNSAANIVMDADGKITNNGALNAQDNVNVNTTKGAIEIGGSVTAEAGNVNVNTESGDVTTKGEVTGKTDVSINSGNGAINIGGSVTATDNDVNITTGSGAITTTGNVTGGTNVKVDAGTTGNIELGGDVTAEGGDVVVTTDDGYIKTTGAVTANNDVKVDTLNGLINLGGLVDAETGFVNVTTGSGSITTGGYVSGHKDVTLDSDGGDITVGGYTESETQNVTATVKGDGNINFAGTVSASGDVKAEVTGEGDITTGENAAVSGTDIIFTTNVGDITTGSNLTANENVDLNVNTGNITFGGDVTANDGNITIDITGDGNLQDAENKDNTLTAYGPEGSEDAGNIIIKLSGKGDVDLYDLYATNNARLDIANGSLNLHEIDGQLVAIQLRSEGKDMNVGKITAGTQIVLSGSDMSLDDIAQRPDADGMLIMTPSGSSVDKPIDNFTIGNITTNADSGIRFEHLWVNNSDIHMSQGQLWFDKLYVENAAHFSNDDMVAAIYGVPPLRDGSDSVYWNNTAENRPEDNLDLWQSGNGDWMYLRFTDDNIQESNGILLTLDEYDYVYDQRFTAEDHLRWQHGRYLDEDWKQAYGYGLSLHDRYGLIDYQHFTEENAGEDEIAVEA